MLWLHYCQVSAGCVESEFIKKFWRMQGWTVQLAPMVARLPALRRRRGRRSRSPGAVLLEHDGHRRLRTGSRRLEALFSIPTR